MAEDALVCADIQPRVGERAYLCSLPAGHEGNHRAKRDDGTNYAVWPASEHGEVRVDPEDVELVRKLVDTPTMPDYNIVLFGDARSAIRRILDALETAPSQTRDDLAARLRDWARILRSHPHLAASTADELDETATALAATQEPEASDG